MKKKKVTRFIKRGFKELWATIKMPEMQVLPGQLAFFFLLSIVPMIALIGYLAINFSVSTTEVMNFINDTFPTDVSEMLYPILKGERFTTNMFIFLISSFILASNGANSIILVSNNLYKIKIPHLLKRRIKAIIMTFFIVLLLIFILLVPTFGTMLLDYLSELKVINFVSDEIRTLFDFFKYPVSLIYIYFNVKLIYTMAPDKKIKSRNVTKGAIFTALGWVFASNLYSIYINNFNRYDILYGGISNLIILLLWIYVLSYIFVLGLALNTSNVSEE